MQLPVLLGLAALWIIVLAPDIIRRRSTRRPGDSISSFRRHLSSLDVSPRGRSTDNNVVSLAQRASRTPMGQPVAPLVQQRGMGAPASLDARRQAVSQRQTAQLVEGQVAPGRTFAQQRRQDVIVGMIAASLLTFLATVTFSGLFLYLHIAIDVALVVYVLAVLSVTKRHSSRSADVAYLPQAQFGQMAAVPAQQRRVASR